MEFDRRHPDQPGPPRQLALWAEAALNDRFEPDRMMIDPFDGLTNRPGGPGPFEDKGNVTSGSSLGALGLFPEVACLAMGANLPNGDDSLGRDSICYQWDISTRPQIDSLLPLSVP
jgi:hypothetical protein